MASKKRVRLVPKKDTFDYYDLIIYAARNSSSARELARSLKCRRWFENPPERYKHRKAFFRGHQYPIIINWGSTITPDWGTVRHVVNLSNAAGAFLNSSGAVAKAINKLEAFKCLTTAGVSTVKWTTEKEQVEKWLKKGHTVLARHSLTGASGAGIGLLKEGTAIADCALWTRNYPKTHEFRVHVFDGQVIDFVEKKAKVDNETGNPVVSDRLVRNHANGWTFAHDNLAVCMEAKREIERVSVGAVGALGLLFGAVDILAILAEGNPGQRHLKSLAVCEVNTAPGLENTVTIDAYKNAILTKYRSLRNI